MRMLARSADGTWVSGHQRRCDEGCVIGHKLGKKIVSLVSSRIGLELDGLDPLCLQREIRSLGCKPHKRR